MWVFLNSSRTLDSAVNGGQIATSTSFRASTQRSDASTVATASASVLCIFQLPTTSFVRMLALCLTLPRNLVKLATDC